MTTTVKLSKFKDTLRKVYEHVHQAKTAATSGERDGNLNHALKVLKEELSSLGEAFSNGEENNQNSKSQFVTIDKVRPFEDSEVSKKTLPMEKVLPYEECEKVVYKPKHVIPTTALGSRMLTSKELFSFDESEEVILKFKGNALDSQFQAAAELVVTQRQGSVSMLQRKLKLGYHRASTVMEQLQAVGIVGPFKGESTRPVLVSNLSALETLLAPLKER